MFLLHSNRKDSSWLKDMCKKKCISCEGKKTTGRLTTVTKREEHKEFCGTVVKQEGDQMERRPAGGKEQHHGGHHSYRTLLPPENGRHLYCHRHVNNSTIQVCQSNTISFVPESNNADVMQYQQSAKKAFQMQCDYMDKQKSFFVVVVYCQNHKDSYHIALGSGLQAFSE